MELIRYMMTHETGSYIKENGPALLVQIGMIIGIWAIVRIIEKIRGKRRLTVLERRAAEREAKENERVIWRAEDKPFTQADFEAWKASKKEKP